MSDECEYLTHLKFPCSGYSIAYIFLEEVGGANVVLQNFDLEALEAEEFMTAVFASSTCSHRSWKLILRGGHFATFSQFSVRRMV